MSGAIGAALPYGILGQLIGDSETVKARLATLVRQASDGKVSDSYAGLGSGAQVSVNLRAELDELQTVGSGIAAADPFLQTAQGALRQIGKIASDFSSTLLSVNSESGASVVTAAQQGLQLLTGTLNTSYGSRYIFAGQDSSNAPVPNAAGILNSAFATQIRAQVSQLPTQGATTTWQNVLTLAGSGSVATSPFSPWLTQVAQAIAGGTRVAQSAVPSVEIGNGERVPAGLLGGVNSGATSARPPAGTGSYARDLMASLAAVAALQPAQINTPVVQSFLSTIQTSVAGSIAAVSDEGGALGVAQTRISNAGTLIAQTTTALNTQVSGIENVDMAATLSDLTQTQSELQASYKLIATTGSLSLVNYL